MNLSEQKKEKIKTWLKSPSNIVLLGILLFSFVLLTYYFNLTKTQTLWWDEAEYMSTAKHWAFGVDYDINPQRPPLFPFLVSIFYLLGFKDVLIKFILEIIPSLFVVLVTYLLVNEMYGNKKLALITSFIMSVSWIHLFYSMRFMTDSLGFLFGLLSFLAGSFLFLWVIFQRQFLKIPADRPMLLISIFTVFAGIQFIMMGLLAELQIRVYHESQNKPIYAIKNVLEHA